MAKSKTKFGAIAHQETMIKAHRLILRPWQETDLEPFAALNADPQVMEYFPVTLSQQESNQMMKRMQTNIEERGWGWWAISLAENGNFIGMNDVDQATFPAHFAPADLWLDLYRSTLG